MANKYENELVTWIDATDEWAVITAPASGSATTRHLPDLAFGRHRECNECHNIPCFSECYGVEHKSTSAGSANFSQSEVEEELTPWCDTFGATALLGTRYTDMSTGTEHYLVYPEDAKRTDSGNYTVPASQARNRACAIVTEEGIKWL